MATNNDYLEIAEKVFFNLYLTAEEQEAWDSLSESNKQQYLNIIIKREYT